MNAMRLVVYNFLVNRHSGISYRYHKKHDNATGIGKPVSWLYLLWLNVAYYIFFCKFLSKIPNDFEVDKKCNLPTECSESHLFMKKSKLPSPEKLAKMSYGYDVVSFDIFDTLVFRPFSNPADVFWLIGNELGIMDFRRIRIESEARARQKHLKKHGNTEVTLEEIWDELENVFEIDKKLGMQTELRIEKSLCFANPYMKKVWDKLVSSGKTVIVTTDMYLDRESIEEILQTQGFSGYSNLYVSSEYRQSKAAGDLYEVVKRNFPGKTIFHIGDNTISDGRNAEKHGINNFLYPNSNIRGEAFRPRDMSFIVGSAYRAIVNTHLYNGMTDYTMEYEYGYIYGGLFVLGYCRFIHHLSQEKNIDKLLFLARDGDILLRVYEMLFPSEKSKCEYVLWSRKAQTKLMAKYDKEDYFRRFIHHKANQGYKFCDVLRSMDLEHFIKKMPDTGVRETDVLNTSNVKIIERFVKDNFTEVIEIYDRQSEIAKQYYTKAAGDAKTVAMIDIGWAGSGYASLSFLFKNQWDISAETIGIIAGTNTGHNAFSDACEPFLQGGKLFSYLYSSTANRDIYRLHDVNKNYNVFWELLLSSKNPGFNGFSSKEKKCLSFGSTDANPSGIEEIQKGILDFVSNYSRAFRDFDFMCNISGRDAYAPMAVAGANNEKYLKIIAQKFDLRKNIE